MFRESPVAILDTFRPAAPLGRMGKPKSKYRNRCSIHMLLLHIFNNFRDISGPQPDIPAFKNSVAIAIMDGMSKPI